MYIIVEGPIGVGKTSLTNILSDHLDIKPIFETYSNNPYLEKFYENPTKWGFLSESFFLNGRYQEALNLQTNYFDKNINIIADYDCYKNLIFAKKNLTANDFEKFEQIFNILLGDIKKPDLFIFIKSSLDTLLLQISKRGRDFEKDIDPKYLNYLIIAYNNYAEFLISKFPKKVLIIDRDKLDFVNNFEDRREIFTMIEEKIKNV